MKVYSSTSLLLAIVVITGCTRVIGRNAPDSGTIDGDSGRAPPIDAGLVDAHTNDTGVTEGEDAAIELLGYGASCTEAAECAGGRCLIPSGTMTGTCSRTCEPAIPNACRAERALCLELTSGGFVCYGPEIPDTGDDVGDDGNLALGDCVRRDLRPLGDADLFTLRSSHTAPPALYVLVTPDSGVDVGITLYDGGGSHLASLDDSGSGEQEGLRFPDWDDAVAHVVVADVGSSVAGGYQICFRSE